MITTKIINMAFPTNEAWYLYEYGGIKQFPCCFADFKESLQCVRCRRKHREPHCPSCDCPQDPEKFPCCGDIFIEIKQCYPCRDAGLPYHCDDCKHKCTFPRKTVVHWHRQSHSPPPYESHMIDDEFMLYANAVECNGVQIQQNHFVKPDSKVKTCDGKALEA